MGFIAHENFLTMKYFQTMVYRNTCPSAKSDNHVTI